MEVTRASFLASVVILAGAGASCSSEETTPAPATSDAGDAGDSGDSGTIEGDAGPGETCIGYGAGESCETEATQKYGYVCFGGAPPGVQGCKLRLASSVGNSYCCSENVCVEQIDQGAACNGVVGKPHRFQCPPTTTGNATPPADCEEHNSGSTEVEKYYCCP